VISRPRPDELPEVIEPVFDVSDGIVRDRSFGPGFDLDDKDRVVAAYEAHNDAVRAGVPPERLLEFDVAEGWDPLCRFLGVPVPDGQFPNVNDREQFKALFGLDEPERAVGEDELLALQDRFEHTLRDGEHQVP
jgi:hypothetical protein